MTKSIQKRCILFLGMAVLIMACAKEQTTNPSPPREIETLQPSNYLMAYPKSWWIYSDTKGGQEMKLETGEAYVLDSTPVKPQSQPYVNYIVKKVPTYYYSKLWGNKIHRGIEKNFFYANEFTEVIPDSSFVVGKTWYDDNSRSQESEPLSMVYAPDTSIRLLGVDYKHVLMIRSYTRILGHLIYIIKDSYYLKNVGLVGWRNYPLNHPRKSPIIHLPVDSAISDYGLKDYFINH